MISNRPFSIGSKMPEILLFQPCFFLLFMTLTCTPVSVEVKSRLPKQNFRLPKEKRIHPGSRIQRALQEGLVFIHKMHFSSPNPHVRPEDHV